MYLLKLISTVGSKMHSVHKRNCVSLTAFWKPNQQKNQKSALVHIYLDLKHNICFFRQTRTNQDCSNHLFWRSFPPKRNSSSYSEAKSLSCNDKRCNKQTNIHTNKQKDKICNKQTFKFTSLKSLFTESKFKFIFVQLQPLPFPKSI